MKTRRLIAGLALMASATCITAAPLDEWHWRNPLPLGHSWYGIAFAGGQFLAVGDGTPSLNPLEGLGASVITSPDGLEWAIQRTGRNVVFPLTGLAFGNGRYVAIGVRGTVATSVDAAAWAPGTTGTEAGLNAVAFGNGVFVAVGAGTTATSPDGINWTDRNDGNFVARSRLAFGNGLFVAIGPASIERVYAASPFGSPQANRFVSAHSDTEAA